MREEIRDLFGDKTGFMESLNEVLDKLFGGVKRDK